MDELLKKVRVIVDANPDGLSKEQSDEVNGHYAKYDELKVIVDNFIKLEAGEKFLNEPGKTQAAHHGWRESGPGEGTPEVDAKSWRSVDIVIPFMGKKEIRFHVPLAVQKKGYESAFECYLRYGKDGLEGRPSDRKTLSEGVDTAGGFLVPEDYQARIIKRLPTFATIRPNAMVIQTSRDVVTIPRVNYSSDDKYTSGIRITWTGEQPASATTHRVTDQVYGVEKIPVHTGMASQPISNDLIEDSVFDVIGFSSELFAENIGVGEEAVFTLGTGVAQPMGLMTQVAGAGPAAVNIGASSLITAAGVIDVFYGLPAQYRQRAQWGINSTSMANVEGLTDDNGRYIVSSMVNGSSLETPIVERLKGKPVLYNEHLADEGSNAYPVFFGDLSGYYIVDRVGLSIQVLKERYAEENLTLLLAKKRVGGYCAEPHKIKAGKTPA
jgi:HK97 family phage major capsid protein